VTSLVGCLGDDPVRLQGGAPEQLHVPGLTLAWGGDAVTVADADGVVCVVAGRLEGRTAAELAGAHANTGALELDELRGSFALLLWDSRSQRGFLATDPLGTVSVFWHASDRRLLFGLEPVDLIPLLERRPEPNSHTIAQWLTNGTLAADATFHRDVERLPGGHHLELRGGARPRSRRHWRLEPTRLTDAPREEVEQELRETIARAVGAATAGDAHPGVLLSGGLDSAVVAAELAGQHPGAVRAFSLVFPEHPSVDEEPLIEELAAQLGIPSQRLPFRGAGLLAAGLDYVQTWGTPPVSPNLAIQQPLLRTAADQGAATLLDGQGGDELFGESLYVLSDLFRRGRFSHARALSRRIPGIPREQRDRAARRARREFGWKGVLPHRGHALARRVRSVRRPAGAPWLSPAASRAYAEAADPWRWQQRDGPRWWAYLSDALTEQRERAGAHDYLRRRNAMSGIVGGHPFLQDLDLIELMLRVPPELAFDERFDRPVLRSAVQGLVPDSVRLRAEKSYFTPLFVEAVDQHDRQRIMELLGSKDAASRAYTQPDVVRRVLLEALPERRGGRWAWSLWRLVMLECWLRREEAGGV
jgi:asparagine synthase (glutamine-hydrolysing)